MDFAGRIRLVCVSAGLWSRGWSTAKREVSVAGGVGEELMAVFRRTRRLGRKLAAASGPGNTRTGHSAPEVSEDENFQDPPRHWGRVGALVGVWALVLGGGAWFAPAFASGGSGENIDPRDEAATDAPGAALRYLRFSSNGETSRAEDAVCDGSDPDLTPSDIDAIRDEYSETLGGLSGVDVSSEDPVTTEAGIVIEGTVFYVSEGQRRSEVFTVTVQEDDGEYCVSEAVRVNEPDDPGQGEPTVEPETIASEYLTQIFRHRDSEAAEEYQCADYSGLEVGDVEQALTDWEIINGEANAYLEGLPEPVEGSTGESEVLEAEVRLDGLVSESYVFAVAVQEDCVASLDGGDGLIPTE